MWLNNIDLKEPMLNSLDATKFDLLIAMLNYATKSYM